MDCSLPGSSVHGILQARILEWIGCPPPKESSHPGVKPLFQLLQCRQILTAEPPGKLWPVSPKVKVKVTQSCLTLCKVRKIAFPFSRGSSQPRDWTQVSRIAGKILYQLSHKGNPGILEWVAYPFSSRSSWSRDQPRVSCIASGFCTNWDIREEGLKKKREKNPEECLWSSHSKDKGSLIDWT